MIPSPHPFLRNNRYSNLEFDFYLLRENQRNEIGNLKRYFFFEGRKER